MQLARPVDEMNLEQLRQTQDTLARWLEVEGDAIRKAGIREQLDQVKLHITRKKRR